MRKIKIITPLNIKNKLVAFTADLEFEVNKFISKVEEKGGKIINIEYCVNNQGGVITAIIIEYELKEEKDKTILLDTDFKETLKEISEKGRV